MIMKKAILDTFRGPTSDKITTTKEFFVEIKQRFVKNEKAEINTFLTSLSLVRYMGQGKKMKKDKEVAYKPPQNKQRKKPSNPECTGCFFCRAEEHKKKHCTTYHIVSSIELKSIKRSIAPTITHGVIRRYTF